MNIDDAPYLDKNKNRGYTFYCVVILEFDEDNASFGTGELVKRLTGYAINEWIFRSYLRFYERTLKHCSYITVKYDHLTYDEFVKTFSKDTKPEYKNMIGAMGMDQFIDMSPVSFTNETLFYNGAITELFEEYNIDYDIFDSNFMLAIFDNHLLLSSKDYGKYFTKEVSPIRRLLDRICKLYVPVIKLIDYGGYEGEEWFLGLPDNVKVNLTKEANFPKPLEELSYHDMVSYEYQVYYYLFDICEFTGAPEDG